MHERPDTEDVARTGGLMDPAMEALPPTKSSLESNLPPEKSSREGVALCLSGGGYRAALFHLGALRRLNELGILSRLRTITSVSGGSIIAAHVATRLHPWPEPGQVAPDWERRLSAPFRAFARRNIRNRPVMQRLLPWHWRTPQVAINTLEKIFEQELTPLRLTDLPDRPDFVFCATDMTFGVNWEFTRGHVGDYQAGYLRPAPPWPLARAVAASSCFPPVFDPLLVSLDPEQVRGGQLRRGPERDEKLQNIPLTDGGVYDNMGLEPVWKKSRVVLVSNGGGTFDFDPGRFGISRLMRYTSIIGNQAGAVRKRWLIANFINGVMSGTYWGISSAVKSYTESDAPPPPGYSEQVAASLIAPIRTDLDAFSAAESAILENHGYLLADAAIQRYARGLLDESLTARPPLAIPHPEWMDEPRVRRALRDSHRIKLPFGRR